MSWETEIQLLRAELDELRKKAEASEAYVAISNLQRAYGYYVDKFQWDHVADLFSRDAVLEINGRGKFFGQDRVREYMHHFGPPEDGILMHHIQVQPVIHIDEDGLTAKGRSRAMMQVGRMGGEALWGDAVYENAYLKEDGVWKISHLKAYQTYYIPYESGWAKEAMPLASTFEDFAPDELTDPYPVYPTFFIPPYHYPNPVSGRK
ncbi:MAG: nuclear transport factor 2 family protein [Sphingomonas sp.]|nr:nuclear transport factor 2 family protein [Sphingomonas sp.]